MKRFVLFAAALLSLLGARAQSPDSMPTKYEMPPLVRPVIPPSEKELEQKLQQLDSAGLVHWEPTPEEVERFNLRPAVSMSSLVVIPQGSLPKKVEVLPNNVLRLSRHVTVSNGSAANWSPWPWSPWPSPGAYLDARTLSMPMPR